MVALLEDKTARKDTQNKAEFVPQPEHIVFAEAFILSHANLSATCILCGDPNRNIYYQKPNGYHWIEGFDKWLADYAKNEVMKRIGHWYLYAEKFASRGSYKHLEMLMQLAREFCPTMKIEGKGLGERTLIIQFGQLNPKQEVPVGDAPRAI